MSHFDGDAVVQMEEGRRRNFLEKGGKDERDTAANYGGLQCHAMPCPSLSRFLAAISLIRSLKIPRPDKKARFQMALRE